MEINVTLVLIVATAYLFVMPIIFRLVAFAHRKLLIDQRAQRLRMKGDRQAIKNLPKPLWPKWREHLGFTLKDQRTFTFGKDKETGEPRTINMTRRLAFHLLCAAGFLMSIIGAIFTSWITILWGLFWFFVAMGFGISSAKPILAERNRLYERMFKIGSKSFHYEAEAADHPQSKVQVLEWDDYVTPTKVRFEVSDEFSDTGEEGFLRQFNQIFGTQRTWVPSYDEEKDEHGWDYDEGVVTLYAVPPLPTMAPWSEHYVLSPEIAWSFFPIGLGVEHGVELKNPHTGEVENVLGFDLAGEQGKMAKHGVKVSGKITAAPMVMVAGGTGGGKALAADTMIYVVDENYVEPEQSVIEPVVDVFGRPSDIDDAETILNVLPTPDVPEL